MAIMQTIRQQLEKPIRDFGIREIARKVTEMGVGGVNHVTVIQWLAEQSSRPSSPPRTFSDRQVEAIAQALGLEIVIRKKKRT